MIASLGKTLKKGLSFLIIYTLLPFSLGAIFALPMLSNVQNQPTRYPTSDSNTNDFVSNEYDEYLLLVNFENPLDPSFAPSDLVPIFATRKDARNTQLARKECVSALEKMIEEMKKTEYGTKS